MNKPTNIDLDTLADPKFTFTAGGKDYEVDAFVAAEAVKDLGLNPLADGFSEEVEKVRKIFGLPSGSEGLPTISPAACVRLTLTFASWLKETIKSMGESSRAISKSP